MSFSFLFLPAPTDKDLIDGNYFSWQMSALEHEVRQPSDRIERPGGRFLIISGVGSTYEEVA